MGAPLRTLPRFFYLALSNERSPSDTTTLFLSRPVRLALPFGHHHAFSSLPCPMGAPLWTLPRFSYLALSNERSPSDTTQLFLPCLVQWALPFGHHSAFSTLPCPIGAPLWTLPRFFFLALSNGRSPSDTTHAFSTMPCPMSAPLRTPLSFFYLALSNERSSLDTTTLFLSRPVQWALPFGHHHTFPSLPCPIGAPLWTLPRFFVSVKPSPHSNLILAVR